MENGVGMPMGKTKEHGLQLRGQTFLSYQLGTVWSYVGLTGLGGCTHELWTGLG